ncbi:MAG: putative LPS assembly protein LptD [Marinilabiliales bacterium]
MKIRVVNTGKDSLEVAFLDVSRDSIKEPVIYNAVDSIRFNIVEQKVYMFGQAQIFYKDIELKADYLVLDLDSNLVYAAGWPDSTGVIQGKPEFKDKTGEYKTREIKYNFDTKKGIIKDVITEQSGGFLHSKITKMQANGDIDLKGGKYTTCDLEHPHFYIYLTKARVIPNDKIVSGPAYLVVEDVPLPLGIPFGFFPNKKTHASGVIIPEYGEEQNRGFFLRNGGYYYAVNDYMDLQLLGDIYSKGSWGLNIISRYKVRYRMNGSFSFKYAKNIFSEDTTHTYQIRWSHNQDPKARPNSTFSANVDFGSSKHNYYNSNSLNQKLQNEVSSSISYNTRLTNFFLPLSFSFNLRHTQNNLDSTVSMSLPEASMNMSRRYPFKVFTKNGKFKWMKKSGIDKIAVSWSTQFKNQIRIKEDKLKYLIEGEELDQFNNGVIHKMPWSSSIKVFKYLNINPGLTYTERWYFKSIEDKQFLGYDSLGRVQDTVIYRKGFSRAGDYQINIPFSTKIYATFLNKNTESFFKGFRHVMTPSISYTYRPDYSEKKYGYYKYMIDTISSPGIRDTLEMYSIYNGGNGNWSGIYGAPPSGKYGSVNFRLGNNFEMKVKSKKDSTSKKIQPTRILDNLSFSTNYNLAADSLNWSDINVQARTQVKFINFNFSANFTPYYWDSLGNSINTFLYEVEKSVTENVKGMFGNYTRLRNANISIGFNLNSKGKQDNNPDSDEKMEAARLAGLPGDYYENYVDFDIPWNLRVNYNLTYSQSEFDTDSMNFVYKTTQTINFSGDFKLTPKWKITFSSGWDFENKSLTSNTNIGIFRDLHCWEASFNWIPMGTFRSYNFQINVKSSVLQSLKLTRKRSWYDNY